MLSLVCHKFQEFLRQLEYPDVSLAEKVKNEPASNVSSVVIGQANTQLCSQMSCVLLFRVCYERCPVNPTAATFLLSAMWHGVYPGYYLTFVTGIAMTMAARAVSTLSPPSSSILS